MASRKIHYVSEVTGSGKHQAREVSINGEDEFAYRYKMHELLVCYTGARKNTKTILINIDQVAYDLRVPSALLSFFLSVEVRGQLKFDPKSSNPRERAILLGEYSAKVISEAIAEFIAKFVMCSNCNLPEMHLKCCRSDANDEGSSAGLSEHKKKRREDIEVPKVTGECNACGTTTKIPIKEAFVAKLLKRFPNAFEDTRNTQSSSIAFSSSSRIASLDSMNMLSFTFSEISIGDSEF